MDEGKIILTTTNARASGINQNYLKQLSSEEFSYRAQATGQFYKELFPTDEVLKLKKGAQVIMIKNDPEKDGLMAQLEPFMILLRKDQG